jgi:signal transduction histidine kinase
MPARGPTIELVRTLARTADPAPLVERLLLAAQAACRGRSSVLLRLEASGRFEEIGRHGVTGGQRSEWFSGAGERALATRVLLGDDPLVIGPPEGPALRNRLGAATLVVVPLRRDAPAGLLIVGLETKRAPAGLAERAAPLADAGLLLLDRLAASRDAALGLEYDFLRKRLAQSEKLAALGQFVAGTAHELNNPLQAVLGHLELIQRSGRLTPDLARDVRWVYREADRAARIVRDLLVFAGSRKPRLRLLQVNGVLTRVLRLRRRAMKAAGIEIVRKLDERLPRVRGDSLLLQQALLNVVTNAEQALAGAPTRRIEVATSAKAGAVTLTVRDTGAGIAPDVLPRIFEPFFTTKDVGQGTGLGLAIAYGAVQEHGGTIAAANHPDGGVVITLTLPTAGKVVN